MPQPEFTFNEIQAGHRADLQIPYYIVRRSNRIVALRVREKINPRINDPEPQVWVGATPRVKEWGDRLALSGLKLKLYVAAPGRSVYELKGTYKVNRRRRFSARQLAAARNQVAHDLSRIVYLKKSG